MNIKLFLAKSNAFIRKIFTLKKSYVKKISILSVLFISYIILSAYIYSEKISSDFARNILRLHVIANSDTQEDQTLKIKVRDAVLTFMNKSIDKNSSLETSEAYIKNNINQFEEIANKVIISNGYKYKAKALLGEYFFPTKSYGDVSLPAGKYEALRIVIGTGEGKNWWCVMFPPLCFVDSTTGVVPDNSKNQMRKSLSQEDYNIALANSKDSSSEIKVKFKIVEIFQESKTLLSKKNK